MYAAAAVQRVIPQKLICRLVSDIPFVTGDLIGCHESLGLLAVQRDNAAVVKLDLDLVIYAYSLENALYRVISVW